MIYFKKSPINSRNILLCIVSLSIGFLTGYLTRDSVYKDLELRFHGSCNQFAFDYLDYAEKIYSIRTKGEPEWKRAIDVETDLFKLCLLNLQNETSLRGFKSTVIENYQKSGSK